MVHYNLGLSYKANTDSTKNSPSIMIINKLKDKYKIKAYDPIVKKKSYAVFTYREWYIALGFKKGSDK